MSIEFQFDVFLSHSAKDKAGVRPLAERLRADGPFKFGTRNSELGIPGLCMSANAFGSDWAQLEAGTFRFRDPLNQERRLIPLPLDDASCPARMRKHVVMGNRVMRRTRFLPPRKRKTPKLALTC